MDWPNLLVALMVAFGVTAAAVLTLWLVSIRRQDVSTIDSVFSLIVLAAVAVAGGAMGAAPAVRDVAILAPLAIWSLRLSGYLAHRKWGEGEDPRYTRLRSWAAPGRPFHLLVLRKVFALQGATLFLLSIAPVISLHAPEPDGLGPLALAGLVVWVVGFTFEVTGDRQLTRFKSDPANAGRVLDHGLWRYTRHPNYFGEVVMAWGIFGICLQTPWAALGIVGPIFYTRIVLRVTGTPTLEKKLGREKPEYAAYVDRTSRFWPRPPSQGGHQQP